MVGGGCGWGTQEVGPCERSWLLQWGAQGVPQTRRSTQVILLFFFGIYFFDTICTLSYCGTWDLSRRRADS